MKPIAIIIALLILTAGSAGALEICETKTTVYQFANKGNVGLNINTYGKIDGKVGDWLEERHPDYVVSDAWLELTRKKSLEKRFFISVSVPIGHCHTWENKE